jgi:hypothetical protein
LGNPRVSGLYDDLRGDQGGGVRVQQLSDRAVVTWNGVPEFNTTNANFIQVEMFFDGRIRITHLGIAAVDGIVGLSQGLGQPADFIESDLSSYGNCFVIAGTVLDAGSMGVSGVTIAGLPGPPVTDANGDYSTSVVSGFSGTATPTLAGFGFAPASRSYSNVTSDMLNEDYTAFTAQLSVTPDQRDVAFTAGNTTFDVANTGSGNMDWTASVISGSEWLSITGGSSGTNSGTITCAFTENLTISPRVATVRVIALNAAGSPKDVSVSQSGAPPMSLSVTPANRDVSSSSGNTNFDVANAGGGIMNWNASVVAGSDWLSITGGSSGMNAGTITCAFTENSTGSQRVGTVRVTAVGAIGSPKDVTVTQAPASGSDTITVVRPNGGEVFRQGRRERIEWTSSKGVGSDVKIELLKKGNVVRTIKASTPNDGLFKWRVRRSAGTGKGFKIRIISVSDPSINDRTDGKFKIAR